MKQLLLAVALLVAGVTTMAQEYKVITVIESIVPMGIGRSRMIESNTPIDVNQYTTTRTDGRDNGGQRDVDRAELKVMEFNETKMLNFFSGVGINFQNVASNDAMIASKINELSNQGFRLIFVTSGVESNAGKDDGQGIFITRMFFVKDAE